MHSLISDERLVKIILGGDTNAFSKLYERYHGPVYSAAYRILQDPEDAQDATQEIFFKLYRSLHSWDREKSKLSTWIYRVASNHSIDCCRIHSRRAELRLQEKKAEEIEYGCRIRSMNLSPYLMVQFREQLDTIHRFIDKLPDLQKRIFIRRYFQGMKLVEIAEIENCKLGTIKSSLYRATRFVRQRLEKPCWKRRRPRRPLYQCQRDAGAPSGAPS